VSFLHFQRHLVAGEILVLRNINRVEAILRVVITSISLHFGIVDAEVKAKLSPDGAVCGICLRGATLYELEKKYTFGNFMPLGTDTTAWLSAVPIDTALKTERGLRRRL